APEPSAGGGQVGASEAQPEKPANAEDGLRDTSNEPITAQKDATLGASDTRQGGTNAAQPPQSGTTTEQPRRRIIDLSDPLGSEVDTNTTKADETKQTSTYASVLKQSIDGSRKSDVICYLNRPSHSMLLRLIELAENESTTDEEMHDAIQQALPYPKRVGTGTFWIETASALASETNDKIIRSILGDNQDAPWSSLMMDFLQINKARGGDVVVSVTSEETRLAMLGQTISILGKDYKVSAPRTGGKTRKTNTKKQNGVDELYYMDIVGTRYNFDSLALLKGLRRLKTNPLYVTYKSTYDQKQNGAPAHPNIWRDSPDQQLPSPEANAAQNQTTLLQEEPSTGHNNPDQHTLPGETTTAPQTAQAAFQSMVEEMEIDAFVQPKKTVKLKAAKRSRGMADLAGNSSWITSNMFDALNEIDVRPKLLQSSHNATFHLYTMDIQTPPPGTVRVRASIRRMRLRRNSMLWHPNNLTLQQIEAELAKLRDTQDDAVIRGQLEQAISSPVDAVLSIVDTAQPETLWQWICQNPLVANVDCTRAFLSNSANMRNIAYLHAWHRWVIASTLPRVTTFQEAFREIFAVHPTAEFLQHAFTSHTKIQGTTPPNLGMDLAEVEPALALFEILLTIQTTPFFWDEAWLVSTTKHPVVWLPAFKAPNMVAPDTLWGLLHATIGHQIVSNMKALLPGGLIDVLVHLQSQSYAYEKGSMVAFVPGDVPALDMVTPYRM
ncbi:hypothetical protein AeMF1_015022, partial [Aphanomyces euteiches]